MNSLFDVSGKVAVVTGGSGVLGSNISEGLLKLQRLEHIPTGWKKRWKDLERPGEKFAVLPVTCSTWTVCGK